MEGFKATNNTQEFGTCKGFETGCIHGEAGKPAQLTVYNTYTKKNFHGDIIRANGQLCKICSAEKDRKRQQTVPEQFVARLVYTMAGHQSETSKACNAIVKKLMRQPCGKNCAWCDQLLSFVLNEDVKTRFCQASVDKRYKLGYTHPEQENKLVCVFCQFCFASDASTRYAYSERRKFQVDARRCIEKEVFDATASWGERAEFNRNNSIIEGDEPFTEEDMDNYLSSQFMRQRHILVDEEEVPGNMTIEDYKELFREQSFRCMITGMRLSLDPKSTWFASPDQINCTMNYDKGNVQFTAYPMNLGKNTFPDVEFRECIQILYSAGETNMVQHTAISEKLEYQCRTCKVRFACI